MKTLRASVLVFLLGGTAFAQVPPPAPAEPATATPSPAFRTDEQLEQLLAPISLYPDALIALILPACVASTDIVLAARHLRDFPNDRSQIEHRAWDDSVKSLTNYPEVLKWLDENLPWTKQVGEAFVQQPADVMQAIQRLRARARAAGTLVDTPQQQVLAEPDVIRIVPAQPDVIYVPRYEPDIVFVREPVYYTRPLLTFGVGVVAGSWLAYDCDWRRRTIWMADRHRRWQHHDWRRPVAFVAPGFAHTSTPGVRAWCPPSRPAYHPPLTFAPRPTGIIRPTPFGSTRPPSPNPPRPMVYNQAPVMAGPLPEPTISQGSRTPPRQRVAPPPSQLRVTDPGRSAPPAVESVVASAPTPVPVAAGRSWTRENSHTRYSSNRPAPQPVMGPQPAPGFQSTAAPSPAIRLEPRASRPQLSQAAPAPQPAAAPAPQPARSSGGEVQQQAPARAPSPTPQRWNDQQGGRRGREDLQR